MGDYADSVVDPERRLLALRELLAETDRTLNEHALRKALRMRWGHSMGRDEGRILIDWLRTAGCVTFDDLGDLWMVTLTSKGAEVARAETALPGIMNPHDLA